jgi:hypothetical protein
MFEADPAGITRLARYLYERKMKVFLCELGWDTLTPEQKEAYYREAVDLLSIYIGRK